MPAHQPGSPTPGLPHASPSVRKFARELGVPLSDLPDDVQEEVRPGLGFDDEVTLEKWLESVQS